MRLLLALLASTTIWAQGGQLSVSASTTSARAGDTITVDVVYSALDAGGLVSANWTLALPFPASSVGRGASSIAGNKSLATNGGKAVVYSVNPADNTLNQTNLGVGKLATYSVTFPANAAPGGYVFALSGLQGVTASALPLSLAVGPSASVALASNYDLNGDGLVDFSDVVSAVQQVIGLAACKVADVNADAKCDLVDVELIIRKVLGL